jgi:hypothetical protein
MGSYAVGQRKSSFDPTYPHTQRHLYAVKVIPIYGENAKIFPSSNDRNFVRVCALFDPLTLEIHVLFYDNHTVTTDSGSKDENPPEKVVISSSFFIPVCDEARRYITLQRQKGVEGKMLGFYKRQCPSGQESLAANVSSGFYNALVDLEDRNEDLYPSLEFYFKNEKDKTGFFNHWSVAFGRQRKLHILSLGNIDFVFSTVLTKVIKQRKNTPMKPSSIGVFRSPWRVLIQLNEMIGQRLHL